MTRHTHKHNLWHKTVLAVFTLHTFNKQKPHISSTMTTICFSSCERAHEREKLQLKALLPFTLFRWHFLALLPFHFHVHVLPRPCCYVSALSCVCYVFVWLDLNTSNFAFQHVAVIFICCFFLSFLCSHCSTSCSRGSLFFKPSVCVKRKHFQN